jgi:glycosyltransferase involved in cell wall biosynthesis
VEKKMVDSTVINIEDGGKPHLQPIHSNTHTFNGNEYEKMDNIEHMGTRFYYDANLTDYHSDNASFILTNENIISVNNTNVQNHIPFISVCIVIPTYNEAHNIPKLLSSLYSEGQQVNYHKENIIMNVLVVDDNSPDGTADIVKTHQASNKNIHILLRNSKEGLGAAYIAGMQHAMNILKPDIIFEMDGDLSHGPEYIMPMILKVKEGADFVIGSRYTKGGSIPENWGIKRKLISKSANLYTKTILGIKGVNDCTGGFRAIRTSKLEEIDLSSLKTKGYAFQISLLEEMRKNNAIIEEVPIAFKDRTNGLSKMRIYDILEEGLFVLKTSLGNIFYAKKKIIIKKQREEAWLLNNSTEQRSELSYSFGFNPVLESNRAFGIEEPIEVEARGVHNNY